MLYHVCHDSWGFFPHCVLVHVGQKEHVITHTGICCLGRKTWAMHTVESEGSSWAGAALVARKPWLDGSGATVPRQPHSWECSWWGCSAPHCSPVPSAQRGWAVLNKLRTHIPNVHYFESLVRLWIYGIEFQIFWFHKGSVVFGTSVPSPVFSWCFPPWLHWATG